MDVTTCVSIPVWNPPDGALRRAVEAVLGQTWGDLKLVVVNDGGPPEWLDPIADITDPRLTVASTPTNVGRYAVDHRVVAATDCAWWAPHDVDDVAEPNWLERLHAHAAGHDAVFSAQRITPLDRRRDEYVEPVRMWEKRDARFTWRAHMAGLWRVEFVRDRHLTNPWVRLGWDTVMTSSAMVVGRVAVVDEPLYRRIRRAGSLTTAPETRIGSRARMAMLPRYHDTWRKIMRDPSSCAAVIRAYGPADIHVGAPTPVVAGDVNLTILSGRRPSLLRATLASLPPGLLDTANVVALCNGGDRPTLDVFAEFGIDPLVTDRMLTIGEAVSLLAGEIDRDTPYWLHLEDDWEFVHSDPGWLDAARDALTMAAQVRLRHHTERVLPKHMVTAGRIVWSPTSGGRISREAHITWNPSLVRSSMADLYPVEGERDMQRRAHRAGLRRVVQQQPGEFRHIGDHDSLRLITGCPV